MALSLSEPCLPCKNLTEYQSATGTVPVNFGKINLCKNKH